MLLDAASVLARTHVFHDAMRRAPQVPAAAERSEPENVWRRKGR